MALFVYNVKPLLGAINNDLVKGMTKAGIFLTSELRKEVNEGQPRAKSGLRYIGLDPSKPSNPPKKVTGEFQRSITWKLDKANLVLEVGSRLDYAGYLETGTRFMAQRPWLRTTLERNNQKIASLIIGG